MRFFQCLFLIIASLPFVTYGQTKPGSHHLDTSIYVVFKYHPNFDFYFGKSEHLRPTTLSASEVDDMEVLVDSAYQQLVKEHPAFLHPLWEYKRQYIAVIDDKGQKEVWIGFYCDAPKGWRKSVILVLDGGACYLRLWINFTLRKTSKLFSNGVA